MTRKEIRDVRRDIAADLDDDLVVRTQHELARVDTAPDAVQVQTDPAAEAEQPVAGERLAPDGEERAEASRPVEMHDAGRIERPQLRTAAGGTYADSRRDDDDAAVREELQVNVASRPADGAYARGMHRRSRVVRRPDADRGGHERKHRVHATALLAVVAAVGLAGCGGGGSSGSPTISIQPARQYRLDFKTIGPAVAGKPTHIAFTILQPNGEPLTKFKRGPGPHTGVHLIMVRKDLAAIVHRHPPVKPSGRFTDTVVFPKGGPYRVVVDVYPQQTTPQPNFQLFDSLRVKGAYKPQALPPFAATQTVDGYTFKLHGKPKLRAIQASFLDFTVTSPDGKPATFTPWYGALAHAIFFRQGSLDYFHTHVCAPGASGCTSILGGAKVTGSSSTPGKLAVGVLVPVAGTWRLFLQTRVGGQIVTVPYTLQVR